eukprot:4918304-Amphidinium_carterae.1
MESVHTTNNDYLPQERKRQQHAPLPSYSQNNGLTLQDHRQYNRMVKKRKQQVEDKLVYSRNNNRPQALHVYANSLAAARTLQTKIAMSDYGGARCSELVLNTIPACCPGDIEGLFASDKTPKDLSLTGEETCVPVCVTQSVVILSATTSCHLPSSNGKGSPLKRGLSTTQEEHAQRSDCAVGCGPRGAPGNTCAGANVGGGTKPQQLSRLLLEKSYTNLAIFKAAFEGS